MATYQSISPVVDGNSGQVIGEWRGFAFTDGPRLAIYGVRMYRVGPNEPAVEIDPETGDVIRPLGVPVRPLDPEA